MKAEMFLGAMGSKFPPEKLMIMRDQLMRIDESRLFVIQSVDYKDPTVMLIISIFLGHLGIDRFLLEDTTMGIFKLLTCGGAGIWTIVDWFTTSQRTRELNYQKFCRVAF